MFWDRLDGSVIQIFHILEKNQCMSTDGAEPNEREAHKSRVTEGNLLEKLKTEALF